jgi:hypothetical protein
MRKCKVLLALVAVLTFTFPTAAFPFYVPAESGTAALGRSHVQAIEAEFRAMEQAALLFRTYDPDEAAGLQEDVNHIAGLSNHTDAPHRYSNSQRYGLLVDSHGWWLGVTVPEAESMRDYVADAAGSRGWVGSSDTYTYPGSSAYHSEDAVVWKLLK